MKKTRIALLLGTGRTDRESEKAASVIRDVLAEIPEAETTFFDVRNAAYTHTVPPWGKGGTETELTPWKEVVEQSDALFIVTPEYNHGYPGELKLLLDSLYDEYKNKPVALCCVSSGGLGGARVAEHIQPVLRELGLVPLQKALYVSKVEDFFDESGAPVDTSFTERIAKTAAELIEYSRALAPLRDNA